MGNYCFCNEKNYFKDIKINICLDKQSTNSKTEHILTKEKNINIKGENEIMKLKKYFDENEQEILNNLNKKEKVKKNFKKRDSMVGALPDNKYELMLKRLLEQKNIKRIGPKRRETIRKENNIKSMVNDILIENRNEIKNAKGNNADFNRKNSTLIIKNNSQVRFSITIDKGGLSKNISKVKKKLNHQHLNNVNTLNEMINEGINSSGLEKKESNKK